MKLAEMQQHTVGWSVLSPILPYSFELLNCDANYNKITNDLHLLYSEENGINCQPHT
jgi:hypothetical protein